MSCTERVIVLVDMDCFYCQVEEKLDPSLEGKPIAVVQYNAWRGGGIIAVNYPAREKGVTRHIRGQDAKEKCPEIILVKVPQVRGKADLTKYREAGKRVAEVLQTFTPILQRASVDEAYLDITDVVKKRITNFGEVQLKDLQNTFIVGYDIQDFIYNVNKNREYFETNYKLIVGGIIAEEIRAEVYKKTGYKCSAGIAHNKILAKLVCGLHKPNKQTILPQESVPKLYENLPLKKLPGLGGKFGINISEKLNISTMRELAICSEKELLKHFEEKTAKWLYNIAKGIDNEPVTTRLISKSIGCCKKFPGRSALTTPENIEHWVTELISEIFERLELDMTENNRRAKQITLHYTQTIKGNDITSSKTLPLNCYDQSKTTQICLDTIKKCCSKSDDTYDVKYLGFSVGNFELNKKNEISKFFENMRKLQKNVVSEESASKQNDEFSSEIIDAVHEQNNFFFERNSVNENNIYIPEEQIGSPNEEDSDNESYQDNTSIYSAETDYLNEDIKSLIFYEDIYPESVAGEPIFSQDNCVTRDTNLNCSSSIVEEPSPSSFFSKYFENNNHCNSSPVNRNFDTSKILTQDMEYSDDSKDIVEDNVEENINITSRTVNVEAWENNETSSTETCPECGKNISKSEFTSHMDYHYALNIVREEAHLYKPTPSSMSKQLSPKVTTNSQSKRSRDMKPIHTYLRINELNEENSELCSECNKRIKFEDVINHMDYHAAKKLHLEINSKPSVPSRNNTEKISAKGKKQNVKKARNIISFFRP